MEASVDVIVPRISFASCSSSSPASRDAFRLVLLLELDFFEIDRRFLLGEPGVEPDDDCDTLLRELLSVCSELKRLRFGREIASSEIVSLGVPAGDAVGDALLALEVARTAACCDDGTPRLETLGTDSDNGLFCAVTGAPVAGRMLTTSVNCSTVLERCMARGERWKAGLRDEGLVLTFVKHKIQKPINIVVRLIMTVD
jgi:hypothetical protein